TVQNRKRPVGALSTQKITFKGRTYSKNSKRNGRQGFPCSTGSTRLDVELRHIQNTGQDLGSSSHRSLCQSDQHTDSPLLFLETGFIRRENRCLPPML